MVVIIDNYDSFTYNLYQYLSELGADARVVRNDETTPREIEAMGPERIVISPGPCTPKEAGASVGIIDHFAGKVPVLGVCLGHQCIGEAFGATVAGAGEIMHGKSSRIEHDGKGVFRGIESPLEAIRYHSLAIVPESLPEALEVSARSDSGVIMGVRHRAYPIEGIQFHPESIMTPAGKDILRNFLEL
jgi:anthranilate synthase/aminodeoxychorismate synthase-like glutamine amidotransferase